jgi:hypothetical protein
MGDFTRLFTLAVNMGAHDSGDRSHMNPEASLALPALLVAVLILPYLLPNNSDSLLWLD